MPAEISEDERAAAAQRGEALPDGSYLMRDCGEVGDAIQAYGRAPDSHRTELAALIRKRNDDLKCGHDLGRLAEGDSTDGSGNTTGDGREHEFG